MWGGMWLVRGELCDTVTWVDLCSVFCVCSVQCAVCSVQLVCSWCAVGVHTCYIFMCSFGTHKSNVGSHHNYHT